MAWTAASCREPVGLLAADRRDGVSLGVVPELHHRFDSEPGAGRILSASGLPERQAWLWSFTPSPWPGPNRPRRGRLLPIWPRQLPPLQLPPWPARSPEPRFGFGAAVGPGLRPRTSH